MASKQKRTLIVGDYYRLWKCENQTHTRLDLDTVSTVLPREPGSSRVTIFIVDFIFFYVTIYSLFPL